MDTLEQFVEKFLVAVDFQDPVDATGSTELASLPEWDSLAALGVIVMADVDYGKTIVGKDLKSCATIEDLYKIIVG
jgi:acyl carrier protein